MGDKILWKRKEQATIKKKKKSEIIKMASTSNREKGGEKKKKEWKLSMKQKYVEAMNLSKGLKLFKNLRLKRFK